MMKAAKYELKLGRIGQKLLERVPSVWLLY